MATGPLNKGYVAHYGVTHAQRFASLITSTRLSVFQVLANQSRVLLEPYKRARAAPGSPGTELLMPPSDGFGDERAIFCVSADFL